MRESKFSADLCTTWLTEYRTGLNWCCFFTFRRFRCSDLLFCPWYLSRKFRCRKFKKIKRKLKESNCTLFSAIIWKSEMMKIFNFFVTLFNSFLLFFIFTFRFFQKEQEKIFSFRNINVLRNVVDLTLNYTTSYIDLSFSDLW